LIAVGKAGVHTKLMKSQAIACGQPSRYSGANLTRPMREPSAAQYFLLKP